MDNARRRSRRGTLGEVTAHRWHPRCSPPLGLVRPVPLDPEGLAGPTRGQARGPRWRATSHGLYVPAGVDGTLPEQRVLEQSARLPPGGAVTGWAALRLHGGTFFDGLAADRRTVLPVPLVVPRGSGVRSDRAVTVAREPLDPSEVQVVRGVACTTVLRATFDEMRRTRDLREATVAMDMAAAALLVSVRRMAGYAARRRSWRRCSLVLRALRLADEDSRSPNETRMRLVWLLDARFPRPSVNRRIWDRTGRLLGIADLLDEAAGVVGEFDGADHRGARRQADDLRREERLSRVGLEVFRVAGLDLREPARVAARMAYHRARGLWLPPRQRAWTVVPPPGADPAETLDDYLEGEDFRREMLEQHDRELRAEAAARRCAP